MNKILIVDDEVENREISENFIRNNLGSSGLIFAQDGIEAYFSSIKEKFDLIILDHKIPRLNGLDLLIALRNTPNPS